MPPKDPTAKEQVLLTSQLQKQLEDIERRQASQQSQINQLPINTTPPQNPSGAVNMLYNGAFTHSIKSWFNTGSGNQAFECFNWFSHPIQAGQPMYKNTSKTSQIQISWNAVNVNTGTDVITVSTSAGVIWTGLAFLLATSGTTPAPLVAGNIYYVIYVSSTSMKVALTADDAAAGIAINLTTQGTGNSSGTVNFALKNSSDTQYSDAFADWDWTEGAARYQAATDISTFFPGQNIRPGYTYNTVASFVRLNQYVTCDPSVRLFAGIYGESTALAGWDWLYGAFSLTDTILGTVATPTSRDYLVNAVTNRDFTINSTVLTVAGAPSDTDFANGARVALDWKAILNYGVQKYNVYRNTAGTYRLLYSVTNVNQTNYTDNGSFQETAIGYPSADFDKLVAYTSTAKGIVDQLPYMNDPLNPNWASIPFSIKVPQNYDMSDTVLASGQWLRIGFQGISGNLDLEMPDGFTSAGVGTTTTLKTVSSGQFTATQVGDAITVSDALGNLIVSTTIATYVSANEITIGSVISQGLSDLVVYITGGAPIHSLYVDLVATGLVQGAAFSPNAEDISSARGTAPVMPNGTSQGNSGQGQPPNTPDGSPVCLLHSEMVIGVDGDVPFSDIEVGDKLKGMDGWNTVTEIKDGTSDVWLICTENGAEVQATPTKQIFTPDGKKSVAKLKVKDIILTYKMGVEPSPIIAKHKLFDKERVRQISLSPQDDFLAGSREYKVVCSNRKAILGGPSGTPYYLNA